MRPIAASGLVYPNSMQGFREHLKICCRAYSCIQPSQDQNINAFHSSSHQETKSTLRITYQPWFPAGMEAVLTAAAAPTLLEHRHFIEAAMPSSLRAIMEDTYHLRYVYCNLDPVELITALLPRVELAWTTTGMPFSPHVIIQTLSERHTVSSTGTQLCRYVHLCKTSIQMKNFFRKVNTNIIHALPVNSICVVGLTTEEVRPPLSPNALNVLAHPQTFLISKALLKLTPDPLITNTLKM